MAEEYGLNIATKAGDGEANIWHWEGVQKTINNLYTRDLYRQKQVNDEYTKAQSKLATQATGLRAADIPDFQKAYGTFRDASLQLQNRKVYNDANQRAFYSKLKDDSYAEAISLAERSKEATKTKASYYNNWMQSGGLNASDDFHEKMNQYDALSVNQIRDTHFDNPMNFFNPKDDTPSELNKKILGAPKTVEERTPFYDPKGVKWYDEVNKFAIGSENPLGIVANNALTELHKSKSLTRTSRDEFGNIAPQQAKTTIDAANQLVNKENPQAPPLPYDYTGYFAAKWINQARTKTPAGDKKTEYDEAWMKNNTSAQEDARQKAGFAHTDANQRKLFAHQDATQAKRDAKVAASYGDMDTEPVYKALRTGDREASWKALSAVASNNPDKPIPFMVSRLDLLDDNKTKELYSQLGIDPASVKYKNTVENDTPQKKRDRMVQASLDAINAKSGGDKISLRDIEMGKIVGGFIHKGQVNEIDASTSTYKGTKETSLPIIINPQQGSPERFKALVNNIAVRKNKRELAAQEADMNGIYPGLPSTPKTAAPTKKKSAREYGLN